MSALIGLACMLNFSVHGQNLIERTLRQLPKESVLPSNEISKTFSKLKNAEKVKLFQNERASQDPNTTEVPLEIVDEGFTKLKALTTKHIDLEVALSNAASFDLSLQRVQLFSETAELKDQNGKKYEMIQAHTFRGFIKDDPNSMATVTIIGKNAHISISDNEATYVISSNDQRDYKLFIDDSLASNERSCGNPDDSSMDISFQTGVVNDNKKDAGDIVEVFVECDYRMFQNEGGVTQTQSYVTALFNEIASLYSNENITLQVSDILVWTNTDPYIYSFPASFAALQDYGAERQNNYDGRLAALLQGSRTSNCSVSGIAWVGVLCSSYNSNQDSGPYSVTNGLGVCSLNSFPSYSIDVSVTAHELGHNFGSPHTHRCAWGSNSNRKIDACGDDGNGNSNCQLVQNPTPPAELGTIMSYCSGIDFTKGFGTEPGALIYNNYVAAGCLTPGGSNNDSCTHINKTYGNETISGARIVRADNNITFNGVVNINNFANVFLQMENTLNVNGTLEISTSAELMIVAEDCD